MIRDIICTRVYTRARSANTHASRRVVVVGGGGSAVTRASAHAQRDGGDVLFPLRPSREERGARAGGSLACAGARLAVFRAPNGIRAHRSGTQRVAGRRRRVGDDGPWAAGLASAAA